MRCRAVLLTLSLYLAFALVGCSKPSTESSPDTPTGANPSDAGNTTPRATKKGEGEARERKEAKDVKAKRAPIVVHSGTALTVSLGSALGSKVSQSRQTFSGSVANDVLAGDTVAIPQGAEVSGTVTAAKALGKFAGGAALGGIIGGLAGGGKGAAIGLAAGAGAALTGNQEITLPARVSRQLRVIATPRSETIDKSSPRNRLSAPPALFWR